MITVIGSLNIDLVAKVPDAPLPGETKIGSDFHIVPGGKGANQAIASRRAGIPTRMVGCVGDDAFGKLSIQSQRDSQVCTDHIHIISSESTGTAIIQIDDKGQNRIVIIPGANQHVSKVMIDTIWHAIQSSDCFLLQNEIPLSTNEYILRLANQAGVPVVLNAAPYLPLENQTLELVDILVVNESESSKLSGIEVKDQKSAWFATEALHARGAKCVITTLGENGSIYSDQKSRWYQPAFHVRVADTTAAGDTFVGAFAAARQSGMTVPEALRFATVSASIAVSRLGAQPSIPDKNEIYALLSSCPMPILEARE